MAIPTTKPLYEALSHSNWKESGKVAARSKSKAGALYSGGASKKGNLNLRFVWGMKSCAWINVLDAPWLPLEKLGNRNTLLRAVKELKEQKIDGGE